MKNFKIQATLFNRPGIVCGIWAVIQQLIVAGSTYLIIESIRQATGDHYDKAVQYIGLFVLSLMVVYIPNTISLIYLQKWRLESFSQFVAVFVRFNKGKTTLSHGRTKTKYESWLTNESYQVYDESTDLLFQVFSTLLNSVLNIAVISLAIDKRIVLWYLIAGVILLLSNRLFKSHISKVSLFVQESRKNLFNTLLSSWENIFVGNSVNLSNWQEKFANDLDLSQKSAVKYDLVRSLVSSITVSLALLIIAFGNGVYLFENSKSVTGLAALIATLPRQVQIIQNIFAFFNIYLSWEGVRSRLVKLEEILFLSAHQKFGESEKYISFDKMSIKGSFPNSNMLESVDTLESMQKMIDSYSTGRLTLRGENGAGKSTLLSLLAEASGSRSYFLPSRFVDLAFQNPNMVSSSDGNRVLDVFKEIESIEKITLLLLDEWDANLDEKNIIAIDSIIDRLASRMLVIESRHRSSISEAL